MTVGWLVAVNEPFRPPRFDDDTFGCLVLGMGELFSTRFYHMALLLVAGRQRIQIDLPCPYFKILAEATKKAGLALTPAEIDDYVVTHVHGDHSNGCEAIGFYKRFVQNAVPRLYVLPEVAGPLWDERLKGAMGYLTDRELNPLPPATLASFFDAHPVVPESPTRIGEVTLSVRRTLHAVPCMALKFEWRGRRIGYSADTLFDPGLIEWLRECDLIFHETTSGPHTPFERLAALDDAFKRKTALVHLSDTFVCDDPLLRPAEQGAFYRVP